jgi:hypothetical protein
LIFFHINAIIFNVIKKGKIMNLSRIISYQNAKEQYLLNLLAIEASKNPKTIKALLKEEPWFNLLNQDQLTELLESINALEEKKSSEDTTTSTEEIDKTPQETTNQIDQNLDNESYELIANLSITGIQELTKALLTKHEPTKPDKIVKNVFNQTALSSSEQAQEHKQRCDLMRELLLTSIALKHRKDWNPNNPKTSVIKSTRKAINNGKGKAAKYSLSQESLTPRPL